MNELIEAGKGLAMAVGVNSMFAEDAETKGFLKHLVSNWQPERIALAREYNEKESK